MKRSKKIVLVSHCLLNVNSKVESLSLYQGAHPIIKDLMDLNYGIVQLPCPEMSIYGLARWGHVKEQFDHPFFRKQCKNMFEPFLFQIQEYISRGYEIRAILSVEGSPSCGYNLTCKSEKWKGELLECKDINSKLSSLKMVDEKGVFMKEIEKILEENSIDIPFVGIDESDPFQYSEVMSMF